MCPTRLTAVATSPCPPTQRPTSLLDSTTPDDSTNSAYPTAEAVRPANAAKPAPTVRRIQRTAGTCHLSITRQSGAIGASFTGELDIASAPPLSDLVVAQLHDQRIERLVVDLAGVSFLAVAGIQELFRLHAHARQTGAAFRIIATSHPVVRPLGALGLLEVLNVHPRLLSAAELGARD